MPHKESSLHLSASLFSAMTTFVSQNVGTTVSLLPDYRKPSVIWTIWGNGLFGLPGYPDHREKLHGTDDIKNHHPMLKHNSLKWKYST